MSSSTVNWLSKFHPFATLALSSILPLLVGNDSELLDVFSLGFVILTWEKRILVEQLIPPALVCIFPHLENKTVCSNFVSKRRHAQISFPAEVIRILPHKVCGFFVPQKEFSYDMPLSEHLDKTSCSPRTAWFGRSSKSSWTCWCCPKTRLVPDWNSLLDFLLCEKSCANCPGLCLKNDEFDTDFFSVRMTNSWWVCTCFSLSCVYSGETNTSHNLFNTNFGIDRGCKGVLAWIVSRSSAWSTLEEYKCNLRIVHISEIVGRKTWRGALCCKTAKLCSMAPFAVDISVCSKQPGRCASETRTKR